MKQVLFFYLLLISILCSGQDIHFSNILHNKILTNPSLSSSPSENNTVGIIHRIQGKSISVPYKTYGIWLNKTINPEFLNNDIAGYALIATNDIAGDGNLQDINISLSGSYTKFLLQDRFAVSLGYGIGITNRSIDFSSLTFGSQWNGHSFDPGASQNEPYITSSFYYLDMNAGISAFYIVSEQIQIDGGIALDHIKEPKETFYVNTNQLSRRVSVYISSRIRKENLQFSPGAIYLRQAGTYELIFGSDVMYSISEYTIGGGLWYRWDRDIIPSLMIAKGKFELTFAYDTNIGIMHPASMYQGGMEISVRMTFGNKQQNKYDCDEVEF